MQIETQNRRIIRLVVAAIVVIAGIILVDAYADKVVENYCKGMFNGEVLEIVAGQESNIKLEFNNKENKEQIQNILRVIGQEDFYFAPASNYSGDRIEIGLHALKGSVYISNVDNYLYILTGNKTLSFRAKDGKFIERLYDAIY